MISSERRDKGPMIRAYSHFRRSGTMWLVRKALGSATLWLPLLIIQAIPSCAQDPPDIAQGMNPSATYHGGDFDFVDMATGHLHLNIPLVVDGSQRGKLNFTYSLSFTSAGPWNTITNGSGHYQVEPPAYGIAAPSLANKGTIVARAKTYTNDVGDRFYAYFASDGEGGQHPLGLTSGNGLGGTSTLESIDGSGINSSFSGAGAVFATRNDGVRWWEPISPFGYQEPAGIDPNGNEFTPPRIPSGDLGRTLPTILVRMSPVVRRRQAIPLPPRPKLGQSPVQQT